MKYEGQICQAPMERASFSLPVMVGCSYGQCKFCNLFRHLKYRIISMEEIEAELLRVYNLGGRPKKIFLGDGNAFGLPTEHLLEIIERIHFYFPECKSINMDATVSSILSKSDEELKRLFNNGVRHLYLGIESGLDDVLLFMNKDHNTTQAYKAISRIQRAGLIYDAHIMTGVAGHNRGIENAEALANFINETKPRHVVNFSMFLHKEVPLFRDIEEGKFFPATELENIIEEKHLIQQIDTDLVYEGLHDYIEFRIRGTLPRDKARMIQSLEKEIEKQTLLEKKCSFVTGECPFLKKMESDENIWCIHNIK